MLDLDRLPEVVEREGGINRRLFVAYLAALAAVPFVGRAEALRAQARPVFAADPFRVGVASGDPSPTGVVLWTRLCPDPAAPDGGRGADAVEVSWEVAEDEGMRKIVRRGRAMATRALGHSVHAEVEGLAPDRWYWYRFRAGDAESPVARTRTLPAVNTLPGELTFAFTSCQHYESGHYTALAHLAREEDVSLVFQLGDYIYEGAPARPENGRVHSPTEAGGPLMTLADYRRRYAQYKSDPHLRAMHLRCPWIVTWDDHEVSNNYANDVDGASKLRGAEFLRRRAAAYQAYYENMPVRARSMPRGADMTIYRSVAFGRLAEFQVLDTRQYRSNQAHGDGHRQIGDEALNPARTMLGARQKAWLKDRLAASQATWNVLAQQVMMGMLRRHPDDRPDEDIYSMDAWAGYTHERVELAQFLRDRRVKNPVVLTGDVHANFVNELRVDDRRHEQPVVGTEFVGTSVSSSGDGEDVPKAARRLMADNPCLKYHNRERGYVRCRLTPTTWTADYMTVAYVSKPGAPLKKRASYVVEAGKAGVERA